MGQASHVQDDDNWDLEEAIRQAEQKNTTDLKQPPKKHRTTKNAKNVGVL